MITGHSISSLSDHIMNRYIEEIANGYPIKERMTAISITINGVDCTYQVKLKSDQNIEVEQSRWYQSSLSCRSHRAINHYIKTTIGHQLDKKAENIKSFVNFLEPNNDPVRDFSTFKLSPQVEVTIGTPEEDREHYESFK